MEWNMDKERWLWQMEVYIKVNFIIIKYKVMENIYGKVVNSMKVSGKMIKCMDKALWYMKINGSILDNL